MGLESNTRGNALWQSVINNAYALPNGEGVLELGMLGASKSWAEISNLFEGDSAAGGALRNVISLRLGKGDRFSFWHNCWCGPSAFRNVFPRLYELPCHKSAKVVEMGSWCNCQWSWSLSWRRDLFEWESLREQRLLDILSAVHPSQSSEDAIRWGEKGQDFTVKSCRMLLNKRQETEEYFGIPNVWYANAPSKMKALIWIACHGRLSVKTTLARLGILDNDYQICSRCNILEEDTDHCMLHCVHAWKVWSATVENWGVLWVMPRTFADFVRQWMGQAINKGGKEFWELLLFQVGWSIWLARNKATFCNEFKAAKEVLYEVVLHASWWARLNGKGKAIEGSVLLANLDWHRLFD